MRRTQIDNNVDTSSHPPELKLAENKFEIRDDFKILIGWRYKETSFYEDSNHAVTNTAEPRLGFFWLLLRAG